MHSSCSTRTTTFTRGLLLLMCISPALASCPEGTFERLTDENGNDVTNCAWCDEGRSCGTACGLCFNCPPGSTAASGSQSLTDCVCKSGYTGPDGGPCELDSSCYCLGTTFPSDFLNQEGFSTEYGTSCQVPHEMHVLNNINIAPTVHCKSKPNVDNPSSSIGDT
jgi:hypothetical protein